MRTFAAYLSAGVTFLGLAVAAAPPGGSPGPSPAPEADTLRDTVSAGEVYLRNLPPRRDGRTIRSYEAVRPPALSWIVDRSLLGNTAGTNPGRRRLLLLARSEAAVDTVIVDLTIVRP